MLLITNIFPDKILSLNTYLNSIKFLNYNFSDSYKSIRYTSIQIPIFASSLPKIHGFSWIDTNRPYRKPYSIPQIYLLVIRYLRNYCEIDVYICGLLSLRTSYERFDLCVIAMKIGYLSDIGEYLIPILFSLYAKLNIVLCFCTLKYRPISNR